MRKMSIGGENIVAFREGCTTARRKRVCQDVDLEVGEELTMNVIDDGVKIVKSPEWAQ